MQMLQEFEKILKNMFWVLCEPCTINCIDVVTIIFRVQRVNSCKWSFIFLAVLLTFLNIWLEILISVYYDKIYSCDKIWTYIIHHYTWSTEETFLQRFSRYSEADTSELLENLGRIFSSWTILRKHHTNWKTGIHLSSQMCLGITKPILCQQREKMSICRLYLFTSLTNSMQLALIVWNDIHENLSVKT